MQLEVSLNVTVHGHFTEAASPCAKRTRNGLPLTSYPGFCYLRCPLLRCSNFLPSRGKFTSPDWPWRLPLTPYRYTDVPHLSGFLGILLPILPEYFIGWYCLTQSPEDWRTEKGFHLIRKSSNILFVAVALAVGTWKASTRGILLGVRLRRSRRSHIPLINVQVTWNVFSFLYLDFHSGYQAWRHWTRGWHALSQLWRCWTKDSDDGASTAESQIHLSKTPDDEEGSRPVRLPVSGEGNSAS